MDKMHFLDFELEKGQALYIPPYWWYSIQYTSNNTLVSGFTYNSLVNNTANAKDLLLYYLQQSNTKTIFDFNPVIFFVMWKNRWYNYK